jgi:hypothetical protein
VPGGGGAIFKLFNWPSGRQSFGVDELPAGEKEPVKVRYCRGQMAIYG